MTTSNCKGARDMDFSPVPWKKRKQFSPPDLFLIEKNKRLNFPLCLSYFKSSIPPV